MELIFLGTGAGNGVPTFYCNCKVCREAIEIPRCQRTRCAIVLSSRHNVLIDAPPEISSQLLREQISRIDYLFITHSHHDHCAGLGDIEIYARYHLKKRLPAVMSSETMFQLEIINGSLSQWLDIKLLEPNQSIQLENVEFTGLSVSHSDGSLGYLIEYKGCRTGYIPDTGPLPEETLNKLNGVDLLILDSTFSGEENWYPDQHLTVFQAIETARQVKAEQLYLTHLSMHYTMPVTSSEIESEIQKFNGNVRLAFDGLRLPLEKLNSVRLANFNYYHQSRTNNFANSSNTLEGVKTA